MGIRRRYTVEFRGDAVALAQRVGIAKAARDLGVSPGVLHRWKKLAALSAEAPPGAKSYAQLEKENNQLKKELSYARKIIGVLKKSVFIFLKDKDKGFF